jgi:hypothetical protein
VARVSGRDRDATEGGAENKVRATFRAIHLARSSHDEFFDGNQA